MNTDKNTVIGFILLAGLFFAFFWFNNSQQSELKTNQKRYDDSVALVKSVEAKAAAEKNPIKQDSTAVKSFAVDSVKEQITTLENNFIKVNFSNKGGQVVSVLLKKYKNSKKEFVQLGDSTTLNYTVNVGNNQTAQINQVFFPVVNV